LEILAWSTEASEGINNPFHDRMLCTGSGLSIMLLPFVMKSKIHLWRPRWARIRTTSVGILYHDAFNWSYLKREINNDLCDRVDGDGLLFAIEIGTEDPNHLVKFIYNNISGLLNYRPLAYAAILNDIGRLSFIKESTKIHDIFLAMYKHCFMERDLETVYTELKMWRKDGILFILFDN
jgi:hypothetical protein